MSPRPFQSPLSLTFPSPQPPDAVPQVRPQRPQGAVHRADLRAGPAVGRAAAGAGKVHRLGGKDQEGQDQPQAQDTPLHGQGHREAAR